MIESGAELEPPADAENEIDVSALMLYVVPTLNVVIE